LPIEISQHNNENTVLSPSVSTSVRFTRNNIKQYPTVPQTTYVPPPKPKNLQNIKWKVGNLITPDQCLLHEKTILQDAILQLDTPIQFFSYFFDDKLIETILNETQLYSLQEDVNKPVNITKTELNRYIGILLYASVIHVPNIRDYWSAELGFPQIYEAMSLNRFETLRRFLHFNNNNTMLDRGNPNFDRLHKIRPLVDHLNSKYSNIQCREYLSVDEQLCATKARSYLKQYLPAKPHKWGYKLFVLCDDEGFSYKFEIYTGQENEARFRHQSEPDLGASANVVIRLTRDVPQHKSYKIYCDNYYSTIPLMEYLYQKGIFALGTVRRNRLPNCQLPNDKQIKKLSRGASIEQVTSYKSAPISVVLWKDKTVTLLSTYCGELPKLTKKQFDKKLKKQVEVDCPHSIKEYNRHMGGVDLLDSHIGRYKIKIKSRKWYIRLFYHLLDMTVVNSWILYKRVCEVKGQVSQYTLAGWRKDLAYTLSKFGELRPTKGRRSNSLELKIKSTRPQSFRPTKDIRTDMISHWQNLVDKRGRCKFPGCKGFTNTQCEKCQVFLCYNKTQNCFKKFHCT